MYSSSDPANGGLKTMATWKTPTMTFVPGIVVPLVSPRPIGGAARIVFPGVGAPARWSEITGFLVRHQY
jgi:hypothetical protein